MSARAGISAGIRWAASLAAGACCFLSGCDRASAPPPVPIPEAVRAAVTATRPTTLRPRLLPGWPVAGADAGVVIVPCLFSTNRADRVCLDVPVKAALTNACGVAFDFWCGDVTAFDGFTFYVRAGEAWRSATFAPSAERAWHRVAVPCARLGGAGVLGDVTCVRLCAWRGGTNDAYLAVANLRYAEPPVPVSAERLRADEKAARAWAHGQSARSPEWRGVWCHSPSGLGGGVGWPETVACVRAAGFNAILANLAWADTAYYDSKVLTVAPAVRRSGDRLKAFRAACRREGVACHVWKVCWNLGHPASARQKERFAAAGRTQVTFDGAAKTDWLCPSHPDNRLLEIAAAEEIARAGVDGLHLDYIRYPDETTCFCAGCRRRFEAACGGAALTNWPAQVRTDAAVRTAWRAFRVAQITSLVRDLSRCVRRINPRLQLSAAVYQNPAADAATVAQDWVPWCEAGCLDFICPMDYPYESAVAFKGVVFTQKRRLAKSPVALRPGIGVSTWRDMTQDLRRTVGEILSVREAGLDGFCLFALDARLLKILPDLKAGVTGCSETCKENFF